MKRWIHAADATYQYIELPQFKKQFKKLGLNDEDLKELENAIATEEPEANLGSNVYKFRWAPSKWNTGQSGATRVIYVDVIKDSKAYLVWIYAKGDRSNLTPKELEIVRRTGKALSKRGNQ